MDVMDSKPQHTDSAAAHRPGRGRGGRGERGGRGRSRRGRSSTGRGRGRGRDSMGIKRGESVGAEKPKRKKTRSKARQARRVAAAAATIAAKTKDMTVKDTRAVQDTATSIESEPMVTVVNDTVAWERPVDGTFTGASRRKLAEQIARISAAHCDKVVRGLGHEDSARSVKAAICMVAPLPSGLKGWRIWVIASGQGNKLVDQTSDDAADGALKDLHAEVLSRRGFMHFIWKCVHASCPAAAKDVLPTDDGSVPTIFESACKDSDRPLKLKKGVEFHMYISSAPCGSARETAQTMATNVHFPESGFTQFGVRRNPKATGACVIVPGRTGVVPKVGEYKKSSKLCCTDKLAMWTAVGLQGALLSLYIQPIFLRGLVIGGPGLPHKDVRRTVVDRMKVLSSSAEQKEAGGQDDGDNIDDDDNRDEKDDSKIDDLDNQGDDIGSKCLLDFPICKVYAAPDGLGDIDDTRNIRKPWSKICILWNAVGRAEQIRPGTGKYHLPKHPYSAISPFASRSRLGDALTAVALKTNDPRMFPQNQRIKLDNEDSMDQSETTGDSVVKKKQKKNQKKTSSKLTSDVVLWPPKQNAIKLRCTLPELKDLAIQYQKAKKTAQKHIGCWPSS